MHGCSVSVEWYVLSALAGICLLCVVAGTTVCLYRCYRRRRGTSSGDSMPPILAASSPSAGDVDVPLDSHGVVGALKHASVQHSRGQPQRKSADQHGDVFHAPMCTVAGEHGVVCQVSIAFNVAT